MYRSEGVGAPVEAAPEILLSIKKTKEPARLDEEPRVPFKKRLSSLEEPLKDSKAPHMSVPPNLYPWRQRGDEEDQEQPQRNPQRKKVVAAPVAPAAQPASVPLHTRAPSTEQPFPSFSSGMGSVLPYNQYLNAQSLFLLQHQRQQAIERELMVRQLLAEKQHLTPQKRDREEEEDLKDPDGSKFFRPYQKDQWHERFNELLEYKRIHGDCLVPHSYPDNMALARWVKRQRYQHKLWTNGKASNISQDRIKMLEDVGFVWDSQNASWFERLAELKAFQRQFKHCNVPSNYTDNKQLATWVKCQRRNYKFFIAGQPSNITQERIQHLDAMGFEWELRRFRKPAGRKCESTGSETSSTTGSTESV